MKNKNGFTLIEIMVVVLIIATLASIAYPLYNKVILKSRMAEAITLTEIVREAQQRSNLLNGAYFGQFTNAHVTGNTRLIKASDVTVKNGNLKRGYYTVSIKDSYKEKNNCIIVKYGEEEDSPIFTIYAVVDDNHIWCEENEDANINVCEILPESEDSKNVCAG